MAQTVMNKHDLQGQHESSGQHEDAACKPRASMGGNAMWGIFHPQKVRRAFFFDIYYCLVGFEICKGWFTVHLLPCPHILFNLHKCPIVFKI